MIHSAKNDYYVYALFRENSEPFYIGMGRRNRIDNHATPRLLDRRNTRRHNICKNLLKILGDVPRAKIREGMFGVDALDLEALLIKILKRLPDGPLVNLTAGGRGPLDMSPEARKKISDAKKGRPHSPEHSAAIKLAHNSPEVLEKKRNARGKRSEKARANMVAGWVERRKKVHPNGLLLSEEVIKKISGTLLEHFSSPDNRAKISRATQEAMNRPEVRKNFEDGLARRKLHQTAKKEAVLSNTSTQE